MNDHQAQQGKDTQVAPEASKEQGSTAKQRGNKAATGLVSVSEDMQIDECDLYIDTFTGGPYMQKKVRITHKPTGMAVEAEGDSVIALRRQLMAELANKVFPKVSK